MKLYCSRQKLNEAVSNVQRAVSSKSTMPALEGILIKTEDNKITLFGYDLDICITTSIPGVTVKEGAAIITAKLFSEIINIL